jgi:hypothetical protein
LLLVVALPLASCSSGSSSGAAACSATLTPCGGDITGSWAFSEDCDFPENVTMGCATITGMHAPDESGTLVFKADGTYTVNLSVHGSGGSTLTISPPCSTKVSSCSALAVNGTQGGYTYTETCTGDPATGCTCTGTTSGTYSEMGDYTTLGSQVTMQTSNAMNTRNYCVHGNELDLDNAPGTSGKYGVFTRQ